MSLLKSKVCITCKIEKSIDNFYFRTDTNKYRNQCTKCNKGYETNIAERNLNKDKLFKKD